MGSVLFGKPEKQKSSSTSESGNYAWPTIGAATSPALSYITQGGNMLGSLLGLNNFSYANPTPVPGSPAPYTPVEPAYQGSKPGLRARSQMRADSQNQLLQNQYPTPVSTPTYDPSAQQSALDAFSNATGMDFIRQQGIKALEGSQAGKRMLQSGATGQGLIKFGEDLGKTYVNNFMDKLLEYSKLGIGAGNLMASAGQWSKGSSTGSSTGAKPGLIPVAAQAAATYYGSGG